MAGQINLRLRVDVTNGDFRDKVDHGNATITQTGLGSDGGVVTVPSASEADLDLSRLSTPGYCILRNLDDTNYVDYGPKSSGVMVPFGRLEPGDRQVVRFGPSVVLRWQADTADVQVQVDAYES